MSKRGSASRTPKEAHMGRPRPRPLAEASPLADALETVAPLLAQLEALETIRTFFAFAVQMETALPGLRKEHEALSAEVPKLRQQRRELQAALDAQMAEVMRRQRDGLLVELPPSILAARRA